MTRDKLLILFVFFAILLRVVPHPPNFAPITALALFSGVTFNNKALGLILPLTVMILSDIFLGFYNISFIVYLAFIAITVYGSTVKKVNIGTILSSSLIFFFITNLGVWALGYPITIQGLILCFTLAIPFLGYSILGDLFFSYVLKYSFQFVESRWAIVKS